MSIHPRRGSSVGWNYAGIGVTLVLLALLALLAIH